jgi:hypothetical protein
MAFIAAGCGVIGGGDGDRTPEPTATPPLPAAEDVIATWIRENRSVDYVGDCEDAQQGVDVGKLCSTLVGQRGRTRAYHLGPTFSEYTTEMLIEESADQGWVIITVRNRDPNQPIPGIDWPLAPGDRVLFIGLGEDDCLNIREQPSVAAAATICMGDGNQAIILDGPVEADGFQWFQVAGEGFSGWAIQDYMRLPEAIEQLFPTPAPP